MVGYYIVLAWFGMVWYGMVQYVMVWYGMVWYNIVWYSTLWCWVDLIHKYVSLVMASWQVLLAQKTNCFWYCHINIHAWYLQQS